MHDPFVDYTVSCNWLFEKSYSTLTYSFFWGNYLSDIFPLVLLENTLLSPARSSFFELQVVKLVKPTHVPNPFSASLPLLLSTFCDGFLGFILSSSSKTQQYLSSSPYFFKPLPLLLSFCLSSSELLVVEEYVWL